MRRNGRGSAMSCPETVRVEVERTGHKKKKREEREEREKKELAE